jgi:hypothetical protein
MRDRGLGVAGAVAIGRRVLRGAALTIRATLAFVVGVAGMAAVDGRADAQGPTPAPTTDSAGNWLTRRLGGQAQVFSELYGINGDARRRPATTWRLLATPRLQLLGGTEIGADLLLSSEGNQARQNINQVGFEPTWGWGQLHLGDFSRDYSPYSLSGLRLRGAGLDLERWGLRASVQGGRSAALVTGALDGNTYRRQVLAGAFGVGRVGERSLDLRVVSARDEVVVGEAPVFDTLGLDTLPADLRPQQRNRPQENVVAALAGSLRLFGRRLALKGEVAGAVLTRDVTSPAIVPDSAPGAVPGATTLRTSSSGDAAWNLDAQWQSQTFGLRGGYESVGAGFTSLGLAYLINDRRGWHAGGDVRLFRGLVMLQGRFQRQENNVAEQRIATTTRDVATATATWRAPGDVTLTVVGLVSTAGNDEANDTLRVDNRTSTINAALSRPWRLGDRSATVSLAYAAQTAEDRNAVRLTPRVLVQTANLSASLPLTDWLTAAPGVSAVIPDGAGQDRNVLGSLRLTAQPGGAVSLTGQFSQTFVSARAVTTGMAQLAWRLPADLAFSLQARYAAYGALGNRPAFSERFLTTTLGRSF